ncbi:MAG: hypothetical protein A2017_16070 [Lentisphaerae bacterium GWF2_44_16]|nr:MAG: hypothetical protein A2017_16070 [Lentisphaerae bacterium GWF2_44_16]
MNTKISVRILWKKTQASVKVEALYGKIKGKNIFLSADSITVDFSETKITNGAFATIARVITDEKPFSFFLRDALHKENPIWISEYEVVATSADDKRAYDEIVKDIVSRKIDSDFAEFENSPEETLENAAAKNKKQYCPTWLGIARDMRIFRFGYQEDKGYFGSIVPVYHSMKHKVSRDAEYTPAQIYEIGFIIGHGSSCRMDIKRRLEENCLPILRAEQREKFMSYQLTAFASLEKNTLSAKNVRGSDWLASYANSGGNMLSPDDKEKIKSLLDKEMYEREEEVIFLCRVEAVNTGKVPCYAWFKVPYTGACRHNSNSFDPENGYSILKEWDNGVMALSFLNGESVHEEEMAVLVQPGEKAVFDMIIPHSPLPPKRAEKLKKLSFEKHLNAARSYWKAKLAEAAEFNVPEKKINEMIKAGLLHCDIAALGTEPDGPVAATIGWYSPIGSESAPIIQYFDSAGCHKLAERSIDFFLKRQREDGFIQNFARYQLETGPVLWTMGEHFRYTRDIEWVKRVKENIIKACDYLLAWRERNKNEECKKNDCYGLIDGKVADPDDYYHSFMLNSLTYVGLMRAAEMLEKVYPSYSKKLLKEVQEYRNDIRNAFYISMAKAPVVPVGDGSWAPVLPPWTEHNGATTLFADGGKWYSHAAFASRSTLTGPLYLVIGEVLSPEEMGCTMMLKSNQFPVTIDNACLSQPYYCRHDHAHIRRGEVKAFLKTFYNQLTGLADLETYTFWEHYHHASQHKTHEEGWFLMQTRWILYFEDDNALKLFHAIPRAWVKEGSPIEVKNAASYFGKISFFMKAELEKNSSISVRVECHDKNRRPEKLVIRIPHPDGLKAISWNKGNYDPEKETLTVNDVRETEEFVLTYS